MTARRSLPLLDLDPDLGALLTDGERRAEAHRRLVVDAYRVPKGPLRFGSADTSPEHVGLLLLDGVVSREVLVSDTVSTELLGPGDVVRPWAAEDGPAFLEMEVRWTALTESRVAVLDRHFGIRLAAWPEVTAMLIDRVNARAQRLATTQAISQLVKVDRRLLALFWHLAERWGRITPDGVVIPLTLSHRMLSQLVGARRPTVSTSISALAERGEVLRRDDGTWLVKGEPVGLPAGGTGRAIPARRRFLKAAEGGGEPVPAPAADGPSLADVIAARRELHETLARMRSESARHVSALEASTLEAARLQRMIAEQRRARELTRESVARARAERERGAAALAAAEDA
ncbi:MAG: family transcriptional regulator, cyclic receptor protein [Solirubrobacteraceae bacterium]|jgi:CRP-like cAMP-binding protein|nr:family transcriptional regulator, cyclic receptor protein [Solirubrobacteraceae bacterium]